ncbi:hypothetical protein NB713_002223 [Xanthomonas sacchari]|nr:hypothetical protein [Xanthomonas sacchari]
MQFLDVGVGDRGQPGQLVRLRVLRVHAGAAHRLQHAIFAGVVGHDRQAPVAAEHAVQGLQIAHCGAGGVHRGQTAVVAVLQRDIVVTRGTGDELPQAGGAAAVARGRAVAALHERDQREFGRQVGRTQFVDHVAEQRQHVLVLVGQPRRRARELLLPARVGGAGVAARVGQAVAEAGEDVVPVTGGRRRQCRRVRRQAVQARHGLLECRRKRGRGRRGGRRRRYRQRQRRRQRQRPHARKSSFQRLNSAKTSTSSDTPRPSRAPIACWIAAEAVRRNGLVASSLARVTGTVGRAA